MSKHTKWSLDKEGLGIIYGADGIQIASLLPGPNRAANGQMIAAAPDMYEALQEMVATYEAYLETGVPADPEQSKKLHEKMKAALKKAGGEG